MKFRVYTQGMPLTVVLNLESSAPIIVKGYDEKANDTVYFEQEVTPEWIKDLNGLVKFPMPLSPEGYVTIDISPANGNRAKFVLKGIKTEKVKTKPVYLSAEQREFLECAEWFSQNCGSLNLGTYKRNNIVFEYSEKIYDEETRSYVDTPARVDHETGVVQVARLYFRGYSIPIRVFILEHEDTHFEKETTNEETADSSAVNICLSRGYPKIEVLYAGTKIFPDDQESRRRIDNMARMIERF